MMRNPILHKKWGQGATLIELLVYIALVSIGLTAVYSILIANVKTYDSIENSLVMNQDLRAAMNMITREVRKAGCNPQASAGVGFQTDTDDRYNTDANSIHFTMDLAPLGGEADGNVNNVNEDVGYYVENGTLMRRARYQNAAALQAQPLVENITGFQVTYFQRDGTTTAGAPPIFNNIWYVHVRLEGKTGKIDRITRKNRTERVEARVRVRNQGM